MTHWRSALGICTLSAALLLGSAGGAIAVADPDPGDSTANNSEAAGGSGKDLSSTTEQATGTTETNTSASFGTPSQAGSASSQGPTTIRAATTTEEPVVTDAHEGAAADLGNSEVSGSASAISINAQSGPNKPVVQSKTVSPPTDIVETETQVVTVAPIRPRVAAVWNVITPVTNSLVDVTKAVGSLPALIVSLRSSPTPVTDVITAVQNMLTSVGSLGASLARIPSEAVSLLGFPEMAPGETAGMVSSGIGGSLGGVVLSTVGDASMLTSLAAQPQQIMIPVSQGPSPESPTLGALSIIGLTKGLSVSGVAPVAPDSMSSGGALSFLKRHVSAILVAASLTALVAAALPGILGLMMFGATGFTVGYRQAKAAATLRAVGIARFARSGPLGVVRSGSLIALAPRAPRATGRRPSRDVGFLEQVA